MKPLNPFLKMLVTAGIAFLGYSCGRIVQAASDYKIEMPVPVLIIMVIIIVGMIISINLPEK